MSEIQTSLRYQRLGNSSNFRHPDFRHLLCVLYKWLSEKCQGSLETFRLFLQLEDQALENLTDTAALLEELKKVQLERLSAMLPTHLSQVLQPNEQEMELANQVLSNLAQMAAQVTPGDVVPHESVRRALGMSLDLVTPVDAAAEDEEASAPSPVLVVE